MQRCINKPNFFNATLFLISGDKILELIDKIMPYITGLYTLPWIVVGFIANIVLSRIYGTEKISGIMKKVGLILLFIFIPILLFKQFLNVHFGEEEIDFVIVSSAVMAFLYLIAYLFAVSRVKKVCTGERKGEYLKTVIVNQGRSAAFVGGAMLAFDKIAVPAAIYISLLGIYLFAIVPYVLAYLHKKRMHEEGKSPLPLYLRIYPWYLIVFPVMAALIHKQYGITTSSLEYGRLLDFLAAITIPAALYYVGASIKYRDLHVDELKKLVYSREGEMAWVREILLLTIVVTPLIIAMVFGILFVFGMIPSEWFIVLFLNSILPITSTNMFLIPYGINRKVTALAVTWSTIISIPLFVLFMNIFSYTLM